MNRASCSWVLLLGNAEIDLRCNLTVKAEVSLVWRFAFQELNGSSLTLAGGASTHPIEWSRKTGNQVFPGYWLILADILHGPPAPASRRLSSSINRRWCNKNSTRSTRKGCVRFEQPLPLQLIGKGERPFLGIPSFYWQITEAYISSQTSAVQRAFVMIFPT